jgi:DNA polymerase I-like protein with 3'-5' exonuclease and polymerase domains
MIYYITNQTFITDTFKNKTIEVSNSLDILLNFLNKESVIAIDTETTGLCPHIDSIILAQFGNKENQFVLNCKEFNIKLLKPFLENENKLFIFQNAKFDLKFFLKQDIKFINIYDTFLAESLLLAGKEYEENEENKKKSGKKQSGPRSLEQITLKYCKYQLSKEIRGQIFKGITNKVIIYSAEDVEYLFEIKDKQLELIKFWKLENVLNLENKAVVVFALMEFHGLLIDTNKWQEVANTTKNLIVEKEKDLFDIVCKEPLLKKYSYTQENLFGIKKSYVNWSSNTQKLEILKKLNFKIEKTDDKTLQKIKHLHPIIKHLIEYNKLTKLNTSFGENFIELINPVTGRIHPNFNQMVATGRISSSEPNVLNIPNPEKSQLGKIIRNAFIPRTGYKIVGGDFSGFEARIVAEFSQDETWLDVFRNNKDIHSELAAKTFKIDIKDVKNPTTFKPEVSYRSVQKIVTFG